MSGRVMSANPNAQSRSSSHTKYPTPTLSVGEGSIFESVCLSVCPLHTHYEVRMNHSFRTWCREWPWDIQQVIWFWVKRSKVKVRVRVRVNSNTAWVWTLSVSIWVPSSSQLVTVNLYISLQTLYIYAVLSHSGQTDWYRIVVQSVASCRLPGCFYQRVEIFLTFAV